MTIAAAVVVLADMFVFVVVVVVLVDMLVFVVVVVVVVDMLAIDNLFLFIAVSGFHQDSAQNFYFSQKNHFKSRLFFAFLLFVFLSNLFLIFHS